MGRLFGTDGARGVANVEITVELAMQIGRAAAAVLKKGRRGMPLVAIGKDTRLSGDMLENALCAGLCSVGADVITLGVVPTPAVAFLVGKYKADAGIVISASHNPFEFNGIKIFSGDGFKLADDLEDKIEGIVLDGEELPCLAEGENIGSVQYAKNSVRDYIEHLKSTVPISLDGMQIAVDCGNGAASFSAPTLFEELGVEAQFLSLAPDGVNINDNCGSTHLENLKKYVVENKLQAGIAFDGDADRCLCVDEKGNEIDGDFLMAICALDLKDRGKLRHNTLVATVMSNMGLEKFCGEHGINYQTTKVGDRYVLEEIELCGYSFGGEQSGHIIFRDYSTTGDGQLTALQLLYLLKRADKPLSELSKIMTRYPQVTQNVSATKGQKLAFYNNEAIKKEAAEVRTQLGDTGRLVLRVSGTEPVIRVMIEGKDIKSINVLAKGLAKIVEKELASITD